MRRLFYALPFLIAFLLSAVPTWAWPLRPIENYKTLHTTHFRVSYPEPYRFIALKAAVIAEDEFPVLTKRLKWTPHTPIDIVIADRTDDSNGFSSVAPVQNIHLFMSAPHPQDRLDYFDDWLRMLIIHEMTHSIHIDAVRSIPAAWRAVFGRVMPIGHLQPYGLIEGIAVHEETDNTTMGRGRSPGSRMLLRMAALENNWPTLDQISSDSNEYPGGAGPYIWGGMFHGFLAARYGEEALADFNIKHSGQIWPFWFNHNAKLIYGKKLTTLYDEFYAEIYAQASQDKVRIEAEGLSPERRLTDIGYYNARPQWVGPYELYYEDRSTFRVPQIRRIDIRNKKLYASGHVVDTYGTLGMAVAKNGTIYYADGRGYDRWHSFYDIWRYRPGNGSPERITALARAFEPVLIPGTNKLIVITQDGGRSRICSLDPDTGEIEQLTGYHDFDDFVQFSSPAMHPGGKWIVVTVWHDDGNRDLFSFDLETREFHRLTANRERDIDAAFDPHGRFLYFSSARSGVHNIYALNLETQELFRVTNVLGGAFMPAIDPTGERMAYIGYNSRGYDVYYTELDPANWKKVEHETIEPDAIVMGPIARDLHKRAHESNLPEDDYSVWRTIYPHWWLPDVSFGGNDLLLGATTGGGDVLGLHSWNLSALYAFDRQFVYAGASYTYSGITPAFNVSVYRTAENHGKMIWGDDGKPTDYWEQRIGGQLMVAYPLLARHTFFLGYVGQLRDDLDEVAEINDDIPFTGYWSGVRGGYSYGSARSTVHSAGNVQGTSFMAMGTLYDPILGSDIQQQIYSGAVAQYFPLPFRNHAFALSALGGVSFGELIAQRTLRIGGFSDTNVFDAYSTSDRLGLRGYDRGTARGDAAAVATAQWNIPIWRVNRGISTWPVFLRGFNGALFYEGGFAVDKNDRLTADDLFPTTGAELYLDTVLSYYYSVRFRSAVAYGLRDTDGVGGFHWLVTLGGLL